MLRVVLILFFLVFNTGALFAQNDYSEKFALINKLKKFIVDSTVYAIDTANFYANYQSPDSGFYYYVYVSEKTKINTPKGFKSFTFFGNDSLKAQEFINKENKKEYEFYLYKTAGNSAAKINTRLLSYFNEELAFVIFHEATHLFIQKMNPNLPYEFNESLCDAMGLSLLKRFSKLNSDIFNPDAVANFEKSLSSIHRLNLAAILEIREKPKKSEPVFVKLSEQINNYTIYSQFLKDRYLGPLNMAWMLKNKFYSGAYFYCKMFTGYPSTKITTKQLDFSFGKDKTESLQNMVDKELYLFMDN